MTDGDRSYADDAEAAEWRRRYYAFCDRMNDLAGDMGASGDIRDGIAERWNTAVCLIKNQAARIEALTEPQPVVRRVLACVAIGSVLAVVIAWMVPALADRLEGAVRYSVTAGFFYVFGWWGRQARSEEILRRLRAAQEEGKP